MRAGMHGENHWQWRGFLARLKSSWQSRSVYSAFNSFAQKWSGSGKCLALPNLLPPSWGETFNIAKLRGDNSGSVGKGSIWPRVPKLAAGYRSKVRIDGEVEGEVDGQGTLEIGESGVVTVAKVKATRGLSRRAGPGRDRCDRARRRLPARGAGSLQEGRLEAFRSGRRIARRCAGCGT
jgi:hypothetical protein